MSPLTTQRFRTPVFLVWTVIVSDYGVEALLCFGPLGFFVLFDVKCGLLFSCGLVRSNYCRSFFRVLFVETIMKHGSP